MSKTLDLLLAEYDEGFETLDVRVGTAMQIKYELDNEAGELEERNRRLMGELNAVSAAIGDCRYMDPPDGGDVTLGEQVNRMRTDRDQLTARNAELEAEVGKLRSAMQSIVDDYKQGFRTDWTTAANYADIARNALREGNT